MIKETLVVMLAYILSFLQPAAQPPVGLLFESVYAIKHSGGSPSGTAFQLEYKGNKYLVTNSHVCGNPKLRNKYYALGPRGSVYFVMRIKQGFRHDLCILTPITEKPALKLSSKPLKLGEPTYTLGFSKGSRSYSAGYYRGIIQGKVGRTPKYIKCRPDPKRGCVATHEMMLTGLETWGGASGSPVVSREGNVVGVIMATFGGAVPAKHLIKMLESVHSKLHPEEEK
jgi:S1-C subfamily serine protease